MKYHRLRWSIFLASIIAILGAPLAATVGYTESYGNLFTIELESGVETLIGPTLAETPFRSLAFSPSGALYGINREFEVPDSLFELDLSTGQALRIGDLGEEDLESLTIDALGHFWAHRGDALFSLDPVTGLATLAVTLDNPVYLIAARESTLYAVSQNGDQVVVEVVDSTSGQLTPGVVASPLLQSSILGASFDPSGHLRFMTETGGILSMRPHGFYRLSPTTGEMEETYFEAYFFGDPIAGMQALAVPGRGSAIAVPSLQPALLLLLTAILAAASVVLIRRRRDTRRTE
ncbi:MAG: hypothetical protein K8J08_12420 [Thermoanaerobaculia bacterium]|nr:hypothetical protein [Thermoanaerobaculia bacterium]